MNALYREILFNIIEDVREERKGDGLLDIIHVSKKSVEVMDDIDFSRTYEIYNPDYMDLNFINDRVIISKSVQDSKFPINRQVLCEWIYKNIPKYIYMNLQKIIFVYDNDEDYDELTSLIDEDILETNSLPFENILGIEWHSDDIVVVSVKNIETETNQMLLRGDLEKEEVETCINNGIMTTLVHELRHLAQNNLYLPERILKQTQDDEEDAESFALDICDRNYVWIKQQ